jgi:hypothetical protein
VEARGRVPKVKPDPATSADSESIVVSIVGELDMSRESELLNLVMTLDPPPSRTVVVDLREVTFVDSKGLDSMIKATTWRAEAATWCSDSRRDNYCDCSRCCPSIIT